MLFSCIVEYEETPRYRELKCENHLAVKRSDETSYITIAFVDSSILLFLIVLITLVGKTLACMVLFLEVAFEV